MSPNLFGLYSVDQFHCFIHLSRYVCPCLLQTLLTLCYTFFIQMIPMAKTTLCMTFITDLEQHSKAFLKALVKFCSVQDFVRYLI